MFVQVTYNNMGCFYKSFGKLLDFLICDWHHKSQLNAFLESSSCL